MGKRRRKPSDDTARKDCYVYRPPVPWYTRLLDLFSTPYFLCGLTGALLGLVVALCALEIQVHALGGDQHGVELRLRPTGSVFYQSKGEPTAMEAHASRLHVALSVLPIGLGALGVLVGRSFTNPRVEEVFEQPR
jgi:hypothetical protein